MKETALPPLKLNKEVVSNLTNMESIKGGFGFDTYVEDTCTCCNYSCSC
ncbi:MULTISPECIES: hypothetical protein [unclassified Allomuricauda]|nr:MULTISPECIES: hypothetical protein [unclassified Allomuricauda]